MPRLGSWLCFYRILSDISFFLFLVDCKWKRWSQWSPCIGDTECGRQGLQNRSRSSIPETYNGKPCPGGAEKTRKCYLGPCRDATPCVVEYHVNYLNAEVPPTEYDSRDVKGCQMHCRFKDAPYFTYSPTTKACYCKNAISGRVSTLSPKYPGTTECPKLSECASGNTQCDGEYLH